MGDAVGLKAALADLALNARRRRELGSSLRETILAEHDARVVERGYFEVYRSILDGD
jgi:hypothetical protein